MFKKTYQYTLVNDDLSNTMGVNLTILRLHPFFGGLGGVKAAQEICLNKKNEKYHVTNYVRIK